jgi:hypothetical protein
MNIHPIFRADAEMVSQPGSATNQTVRNTRDTLGGRVNRDRKRLANFRSPSICNMSSAAPALAALS